MDKDGRLETVQLRDVEVSDLVVHDEHRDNPSLAFALSRISEGPTEPTPFGIFRDVQRPVYGEAMENQLRSASEKQGPGDLERLLFTEDTWTVD
jgi:2-oxoglutarate ferredoxin oxidoreductase subunit beta